MTIVNEPPIEADADDHAAGDRECGAAGTEAHQGDADRVDGAAGREDARGAVAVGDRAAERLTEAPQEVLHGDRERERAAVPAAQIRQRLGEQAEACPRAERDQRDQTAGRDDDVAPAPPGAHWRERTRFGTVIEPMPLGADYDRQTCSLARTLEVVGRALDAAARARPVHGRAALRRARRAPRHPARHPQRPSQRRSKPKGLVERRPYSATREEFHLTQAGRDLWPAVYALTSWGERYRCAGGGARRLWLHAACGTELDAAGDCPACGVTPAPEDVETRPGPGRDRPLRDDRVSRALREPHRLLTPLAV